MDRRQEILMAAGKLFRENGYHATSIRDIAKEIDMRPSSLYAHVQSKEEILWEIVNQAADAFNGKAESISAELDARERLELLIHGHFEVITQELPNATVFFHEWKFLPEDLKNKMIARRDNYEGHFRRVIKQGMDKGVFEVEDFRVATLFILSALNWSYHWIKPEGALSLEALSERYTRLIMNTLQARA